MSSNRTFNSLKIQFKCQKFELKFKTKTRVKLNNMKFKRFSKK